MASVDPAQVHLFCFTLLDASLPCMVAQVADSTTLVYECLCVWGGGVNLDYCMNDTFQHYETQSYFQPSPPGKRSL